MSVVVTRAAGLDRLVDARPLALTRVLVSLAGLVIAAESWDVLRRLSSPDSIRVPWLGSPLVAGPAVVDAWLAVTLVALVMLGAGILARPAALLSCVLLAVSLAWDQQVFSNHLTLSVLLTGYLALGQPGGAWSVDSRLRRRTVPTPLWVNLVILSQVSAVYLFAGLSKVNGSYLSGSALERWAADWAAVPAPVAALLAVASVVTEVALAGALWIPRLRWAAAVVGVALHVSIAVALDNPVVLTAFGLLTVATYPLFLTRPRLAPG